MYTQTHSETMTQEKALNNDKNKQSTRFGEITYNPEKVVAFPNGLLGMPGQTSFALAEMPAEKLKNFQVLQSLIDEETSFAVLPYELSSEKLDDSDIDEVCQVLEFNKDDLQIILIASVQRKADKNILTVNMRAPLFIDVEKKQGFQIVLTNGKYLVQQPLVG